MNTQLLSPETKIKIDSFLESIESNEFYNEESDHFEIKPYIISNYLLEKGFVCEDTDFENEESIILKFQKFNPNFIPFQERNEDEETESEEYNPKYFLVNLCIDYMNSLCCLSIDYY